MDRAVDQNSSSRARARVEYSDCTMATLAGLFGNYFIVVKTSLEELLVAVPR